MAWHYLPNRRTTNPEADADRTNYGYYRNRAYTGGWSSSIYISDNENPHALPVPYWCNTLPNCVGYAFGRVNEISGTGSAMSIMPECALKNGGEWYSTLLNAGYTSLPVPWLGAIMDWGGSIGHVAVVEGVYLTNDNDWTSCTEALISESHYYDRTLGEWDSTIVRLADGWQRYSDSVYNGCIMHPDISPGQIPPGPGPAVRTKMPVWMMLNPYLYTY